MQLVARVGGHDVEHHRACHINDVLERGDLDRREHSDERYVDDVEHGDQHVSEHGNVDAHEFVDDRQGRRNQRTVVPRQGQRQLRLHDGEG